MTFCCTFASGRRTIDLLLDRRVITAEISKETPLPNRPEDALAAPCESPLLRFLARQVSDIVVILPDATRAWQNVPFMAQALRREIREGGRMSVKWVIGGGQHRLPTAKEIKMLLEDIPLRGDSILCHNSAEGVRTKEITSRGTPVILHQAVARADLIVSAGGIAYHDLAGFSGGRKSILPGASGSEAIQHNHALSLKGSNFDPAVGCGYLKGNPVAEDMAEYQSLVLAERKGFLLNVIPDGKGNPYCYTAGDPVRAWLQGTVWAQELQTLWVSEKASLVAVSCCGYPYDIDLYQATKSISAVLHALEPKGGLLLFAELEDGAGPGSFGEDFRLAIEQPEAALGKLQDNFTIPAYIATKMASDLKSHPAALVTDRTDMVFPGKIFADGSKALQWLKKQIPPGPVLCVPAGNCVTIKAKERNTI
jgi:nickel-dependent lactate racemase